MGFWRSARKTFQDKFWNEVVREMVELEKIIKDRTDKGTCNMILACSPN
jgi:hypothetical protein